MSVFSDSGILEVIAVTLAVVMMLGPLVPYAIFGRRASAAGNSERGGFIPGALLNDFHCPSGFAFSL